MPETPSSEAHLEAVYSRLRAVAARYFSRHGSVTLQPTALVHEAWLKVSDANVNDREHFCAVAARAMRQILVDRARSRNRLKRGGGWEQVTLSGLGRGSTVIDILALDAALTALAESAPREARVVELRFFGGLTTDEVARSLDCSPSTVEKDWRRARAWLAVKMAS